MTEPGGWIKWDGCGDCPLSEAQMFEVRWEDGETYGPMAAWEWDFIMDEGEGDPVPDAYRVVPPA